MAARIGRQEPTTAYIEPYTSTRGPEAIELYNKSGLTALEWQESLIYDIMAIDPEEGTWKHQKFGYAVPRRNGKSEDMLMRCLWGLKNGERILYTAHRTATAHSIWERLSRLCEKAHIDVLSSYRAMGREHIHCVHDAAIEFRTRTSTGGLGEGYDLLIIDEAQEYTDSQETALKYVVTDSDNPQTIMLGTPPTAISAGTVFPKYRKQVLQGAGFESGWAEWSVTQMTEPTDVEAWYETNPSLGTILKERTIRSEIGDDEIDFNIQRLGLWLAYNQKSAITPQEWDALNCDTLPELQGKLFAGIKFGHDGRHVSLAIAAKTTDGRVFVEAIGCRSIQGGHGWLLDFLQAADIQQVAIDGDNGRQQLADQLKETKKRGIKSPVLPKVGQIIKVYSMWEQAIAGATLCHMEQSAARQAITNCEKRAIGSHGGFGYLSLIPEADISILDSMALAHWICAEAKEPKKQTASY